VVLHDGVRAGCSLPPAAAAISTRAAFAHCGFVEPHCLSSLPPPTAPPPRAPCACACSSPRTGWTNGVSLGYTVNGADPTDFFGGVTKYPASGYSAALVQQTAVKFVALNGFTTPPTPYFATWTEKATTGVLAKDVYRMSGLNTVWQASAYTALGLGSGLVTPRSLDFSDATTMWIADSGAGLRRASAVGTAWTLGATTYKPPAFGASVFDALQASLSGDKATVFVVTPGALYSFSVAGLAWNAGGAPLATPAPSRQFRGVAGAPTSTPSATTPTPTRTPVSATPSGTASSTQVNSFSATASRSATATATASATVAASPAAACAGSAAFGTGVSGSTAAFSTSTSVYSFTGGSCAGTTYTTTGKFGLVLVDLGVPVVAGARLSVTTCASAFGKDTVRRRAGAQEWEGAGAEGRCSSI
jgi:hypothetical protein